MVILYPKTGYKFSIADIKIQIIMKSETAKLINVYLMAKRSLHTTQILNLLYNIHLYLCGQVETTKQWRAQDLF